MNKNKNLPESEKKKSKKITKKLPTKITAPKKPTKNVTYFTKEHELKIIEYIEHDDPHSKQYIYLTYIRPVFQDLIANIVQTFKFYKLVNIDVLKDECELYLMTILSKFDKTKGSKAFSYFSVVTKNWFIAEVKKSGKKKFNGVNIENISRMDEEIFLSSEPDYEERDHFADFLDELREELKLWEKESTNENEIKLIRSVAILFDDANNLGILHKKAIFLYLKEISRIDDKKIPNAIQKIRKRYREFKGDWLHRQDLYEKR